MLIMPRRRSSSVPRHPEPSKTVLIMSADTPKSEMIKVGSPVAMASSAAVEDTVTSARAPSRVSSIEPLTRPTAEGAIRPWVIRSSSSLGYGHCS